MADKQGDLVQGTLDMLILKIVVLEPIHGYGIAVRIEQMSNGVFKVNAGSLFVALQRLHRAGFIRSEWKASENNRRAKYYALTEQVVARDQLTTLMVTHSMHQAASLGDRLIMMHRGQIIHDFQGAEKRRLRPDDLLARFEEVRRAEQLDESAAEMLAEQYI